MQEEVPGRKKAMTLEEVDSALQFNVAVDDRHPFFVDFSDVRGEFEERRIFKDLKVDPKSLTYNHVAHAGQKTMIFLAGMRGSGKTTELAKIAHKLHKPDCFFCIICNLDQGLDVNDMEYMDILIFQITRLLGELDRAHVKIDDEILDSLQNWFAERVKEVNTAIRREGGFELEIGVKTPGILGFFNLASKVKGSLMGVKENAEKIRSVFKSNFTAFASLTNTFLEYVNLHLRKQNIAQEILFIVDGLEKIATSDIRKRLVDGESGRIQQIKANTIFTLPLELMPLREKLIQFSTFSTFPFVKIKEKSGELVPSAMARFREFVYKRVDRKLFDSEATVDRAIMFGGGSPRGLLRILQYANTWSDEEVGQITLAALEKGVKKLAAESSQYLSTADLDNLKLLKENNANGIPTKFESDWQGLFERIIVMEYNDGSYKRVNPIIEISDLYRYYVLGEQL